MVQPFNQNQVSIESETDKIAHPKKGVLRIFGTQIHHNVDEQAKLRGSHLVPVRDHSMPRINDLLPVNEVSEKQSDHNLFELIGSNDLDHPSIDPKKESQLKIISKKIALDLNEWIKAQREIHVRRFEILESRQRDHDGNSIIWDLRKGNEEMEVEEDPELDEVSEHPFDEEQLSIVKYDLREMRVKNNFRLFQMATENLQSRMSGFSQFHFKALNNLKNLKRISQQREASAHTDAELASQEYMSAVSGITCGRGSIGSRNGGENQLRILQSKLRMNSPMVFSQ